MNSTALKTGLLSFLSLAVSAVAGFAGCGGLWEVPRDHFNGVNEFGYVSYWDKIADIDIGEDKPFPVVIGFQSDRETSSPYLGYGWVMPLLESYMVQTGENTFQIMKPTGYTSGFGRDPKDAVAIGGVQGWRGKIGADTIKVWAPCGWSLSYARGKLMEIGTPKGKRILLKRDPVGQVEEVTLDGRVLVKVLRGFGGQVEGMEVEGENLSIELGDKPRVQNIQGKNLIVGRNLSLARVGFEKGGTKTFAYDVTDALQPKVKCAEAGSLDREIVWDAANKTILKDDEWSYQVLTGEKATADASISRSNAKKQRESFFNDKATGTTTTLNSDGVTRIEQRFVGGLLAGALRKIVEYEKNDKRNVYQAFYDERARLIREIKNADHFEYAYDDENNRTLVKKNGLEVVKRKFENNKLKEETFSNGDQKRYDYDGGTVRIEANLANGKTYTETLLRLPNSRMNSAQMTGQKQQIENDKVFGTSLDTEKNARSSNNVIYDEKGRITQKIVRNPSGEVEKLKLFYGKNNKLESTLSDTGLAMTYVYDSSNGDLQSKIHDSSNVQTQK